MNREPIHTALFAKLQGAAGFKTSSRRLKHWTDVSPPDCPALFLTLRSEQATQNPKVGVTVWDVTFDAYVYVDTDGDSTAAPATLMNPLLDAIEATLKPDNLGSRKLTLGGLVEHCWIEGSVATDEGVLGGRGVAIIPIMVRVAGPPLLNP
jgi:hypothetical protein